MAVTEPETRRNIILLDDEPLSRRLTEYILSDEGFKVLIANGLSGVLALLARHRVALIVVSAPSPSSWAPGLVGDVRDDFNVPILFVVTKEAADGVVDSGIVEDYLVRPFSYAELLARVKSILRRSDRGNGSSEQLVLRAGGFELDIVELTMTLPNRKRVYLSPTEMKVLRCLLAKPGEVVSADRLTESVWGNGFGSDSHVRVCVSRVRRKLGQNRSKVKYIEAVRGEGYRLNVGDSIEKV